MTDDTAKTGSANRQRFNISNDYEMRDWSQKFVAIDGSKAAKLGPMAEDVERYLEDR
jgi:hypothetical protein